MNIHIESFLQKCRYVKYFSFSTLVTLTKFFFLQTWAAEALSMSRNQNWCFCRQNKDKSMWQGSSLFHLQYTNKDPRQTGESCCTQVSGACHGFFKFSRISNKLDLHHLRELVQGHQNISDPLQDQFKVGAIFQAWFTTKISNLSQGRQLHGGVVKNCISQPFSRTKKSVFLLLPT